MAMKITSSVNKRFLNVEVSVYGVDRTALGNPRRVSVETGRQTVVSKSPSETF